MSSCNGNCASCSSSDCGDRKKESLLAALNPHSGGVMKKCGRTYEGTLRQSDRNNQGICDEVWYGLLRREFDGR